MYRVSQNIEDVGAAETLEGAREIVQGAPPGRFVVVEERSEPFPSGNTRRVWGRMLKHPDGRVEDEAW